MELWVPFQRGHRRAIVLGERISYKDARIIARVRSEHRASLRELVRALWSTERPEIHRPPIKPLEARSGRGGVLWVMLEPADPPDSFPSLEEVAQLQDGNPSRWSEFLTQFGLPERNQKFLITYNLEHGLEIYRIPLGWLRDFARRSALLLAAEHAVLRQGTDHLRNLIKEVDERLSGAGEFIWEIPDLTWPEGNDDETLKRFGQEAIARSLEQALDRFEPSADSEGHAIPEEWGLYTLGWWPMVLLDRYVYRSRHLPSKKCASPDCSNLMPPDRRRYCSERCRQREKKSRHRYRRRSTQLRERSDG